MFYSVIIPLYNKESFIKETVMSVINQTYKDFELIIVNDSSTDNSLHIVESIVDDRIIVLTKLNGGVSAARNYGVKHASGEYIAFLDADDIWQHDYLASMKELIDKYPQAGIYASGYTKVDEGSRAEEGNNLIGGVPRLYLVDDYFKRSVEYGMSIISSSTVCIRKDILNSISLFREGVCRGEDIDVWLRIALKYPVAFLNESKVTYLVNTGNSLAKNYTTAKDEFPYEEWLNYPSTSIYYIRYVVLVFYIFAKRAYQAKDYETCYRLLTTIVNKDITYKGFKRLYLLLQSLIRK